MCDFNYIPLFFMAGGGSGGIAISLLWGLTLLLLVLLAIRFFKHLKQDEPEKKDEDDSMTILNTRYAKGEVTHEQYTKMKDVLLYH